MAAALVQIYILFLSDASVLAYFLAVFTKIKKLRFGPEFCFKVLKKLSQGKNVGKQQDG
jgi:hypothetical protein